VMQIVEELLKIAEVAGAAGSPAVRLVRLVRSLRIIRVLRIMTIAQGLQLLVICILQSVVPFIWAFSLLFLLVYIAAIYLTQISTSQLTGGNLSDADELIFETFYGTLPHSLLSICTGLFGGVDWKELVDPLNEHVSPLVGFSLVIFFLFSFLVVLNVITGNFVQTSLAEAEKVKEMHCLRQAQKMFTALDLDESGDITYAEISQHLTEPTVINFLEELDIDVQEAGCLFDLLDLDNSGVIEMEEFLKGCIRLQGPARASDLLLVTKDFRSAFEQQWEALRVLEEYLGRINHDVHHPHHPHHHHHHSPNGESKENEVGLVNTSMMRTCS